ncbi:MAG: SLC13 family permease [Gammaproteobacteria bacterium]
METQQVVFLLILGAGLVLFITERFRVDVTAMLVLVALALTGILTAGEALSGFSSEPAIIVAAVFVMSGGLAATGVTNRIGDLIARAAGKSEWRTIAVVMPAVAALAAFTHHLMITAMMLPILMRLARENKLPPSRVLMPMSLAASLGTTLTVISAPAFLLAGNLLKRQSGKDLDIFAITPIGAALVLLGVAYMLLGRWLLPRRGAGVADDDYLKLDQYYIELVVEADSPWHQKPLDEFKAAFKDRLQVTEWLRRGASRNTQSREEILHTHDVLLVRASPDEIASIQSEPGIALHAVAKYGDGKENLSAGKEQLVQAVVAPSSEFIGRTVGDIDFRRNLGVVVVGLWRKHGWIDKELSAVTLQQGDVLVLWGTPDRFVELAEHRGFLMMVPFAGDEIRRRRWPLALGIMVLSVLAAALHWLPTEIAFMSGAVAMVVSRCVTVERAFREIDVRIFVMIAGVIPLGLAMEKTGSAAVFAQLLLQFTAGWTPFELLLVMFGAAAILTQVLSDSATVVLLGPVAIVMAASLSLPAQPFVVCTALGAVASFLTPLGHHGNLLILNPGQYRFSDFLRVGVPLTLLIGATSAWLAQWLWLGGPLLPPAVAALLAG